MDLLNDERTVGRARPALSGRKSASPAFLDSRPGQFFAPPRQFDAENPELIDRPDTDPALVREELSVLANINRRGGHSVVLRSIRRLLPPTRVAPLSILDLGTGAADYPRAIAAWARRRGIPVAITAVDRNPQVLSLAREWCRDWPEIRLEQHDVLALPYAAESFDLVMCSSALHHFDPEDSIAILRRMQELARAGFILHDLRRNWPAIWTMELAARTFIKSRIARYDAILSSRAAFTVDEMSVLAKRAGLRNFRLRRSQLMFGMVLEGQK
jgi:SAM-dependent methyltransferase